MPTYSALTTLEGEGRAEALGEAIEALDPPPHGVGVFEIEDGSGLWEVGAFFTDAPDHAGLQLLAMAHGAKLFAVSEVPDVDWVAHVKRELQPVRAGRFFVYGSHDAEQVPDGCVPLLIEAAMAFGTGHHGTTQGCLLALEDLAANIPAPVRVADIGSGTAVLAMAAAAIWPDAAIIASDIDPVATETAAANLSTNGYAGRVSTVTAAGFDDPALEATPFDLILANILKGPLIELAPDMARAAAPGAHVILSGLLTAQGDDVVAAYSEAGFTLADRRTQGEWDTLTLARAGA